MAEMKTKEKMFRILELRHQSMPSTYMVQRRSFGLAAWLLVLPFESAWANVVEVHTLEEAHALVEQKYETYKQEFSGRIVEEVKVWP